MSQEHYKATRVKQDNPEAKITRLGLMNLCNHERSLALLAFAEAGHQLDMSPEVTIKAFNQAFPGGLKQ